MPPRLERAPQDRDPDEGAAAAAHARRSARDEEKPRHGRWYTPAVLDIEEIRAYYAKILPYYEREVAARADLPFWLALARRWRPRRILELGCGTGRVARALSRTAPAMGIDVSLDLLRHARRRGRASRVSFIAADFRDTVFRRSFDLIIAPSDPLSHLTATHDRRRALRAVARQLAPNGRFVLDALVKRGRSPITSVRRLSRPPRRASHPRRLASGLKARPVARDLHLHRAPAKRTPRRNRSLLPRPLVEPRARSGPSSPPAASPSKISGAISRAARLVSAAPG